MLSRRYKDKIEKRFEDKIEINFDLKRTLVSFQANKKIPGYRWYKFKEGYSYIMYIYFIYFIFALKI